MQWNLLKRFFFRSGLSTRTGWVNASTAEVREINFKHRIVCSITYGDILIYLKVVVIWRWTTWRKAAGHEQCRKGSWVPKSQTDDDDNDDDVDDDDDDDDDDDNHVVADDDVDDDDGDHIDVDYDDDDDADADEDEDDADDDDVADDDDDDVDDDADDDDDVADDDVADDDAAAAADDDDDDDVAFLLLLLLFSHEYAVAEKNTVLATCRKLEEQLEDRSKQIQQ